MYKRWCEIDDNEELFLTIPRPGGCKRMTTDEDDETLAQTAIQHNFWSPTPRAVWRGSRGARALRVVSFDSAHQAQLIEVGGYNLAPPGHIFFS
jgi:hypothetical protein